MGRFSEGFDQLVADFFPRREDRRPVGLSEDRAEHRGDHVLVRLGDQREQVAGEVDPTALVRRALQAAAQRRDQPGMLVGDHQPDPGQAPSAQVGQKCPPERLLLAVAHGQAEDLPATGGRDPGRHHHRLGHHLPQAGLAHMQVGRVEVDVGEAGVPERTSPERTHHLIESGANPRHLGLGDPGIDTQGLHQVIDRTSRNPMHVGLHHHRVQGLIDPPPRLQDHREERALAQLRDLQRNIPGLR